MNTEIYFELWCWRIQPLLLGTYQNIFGPSGVWGWFVTSFIHSTFHTLKTTNILSGTMAGGKVKSRLTKWRLSVLPLPSPLAPSPTYQANQQIPGVPAAAPAANTDNSNVIHRCISGVSELPLDSWFRVIWTICSWATISTIYGSYRTYQLVHLCLHTMDWYHRRFLQTSSVSLHSYIRFPAGASFLAAQFVTDCRASADFTAQLLFHHLGQSSTPVGGLSFSFAVKVHKSPRRKWNCKSIPLVFMLGGNPSSEPSCLCALSTAVMDGQCRLISVHWAMDNHQLARRLEEIV